jgi:hypothetical protein
LVAITVKTREVPATTEKELDVKLTVGVTTGGGGAG